ncbi:MAG: RDD family protein [Microbacteriaceae bacterium]|nr:RDD family protein [Cryobacterium sp.]MCC6376345.1 RDD family protein [Microbacteriaceae bacterium]
MASGVAVSKEFISSEDEGLITGAAVALSLRPTPYVLRAAGAAIDFVVTLLLLWGLLMSAIYGLFPLLAEPGWISVISIAIIVFCFIVAPVTVELISRGKSLGKLAVGARIVREDGGAIGFRHSVIRALIGVIEIIGTIGGLATIVALLDPRGRRLGDLLAGTYSQYERLPKLDSVPFGVPLELAAWAETADVARMPDRLARRISQFMKSANTYSPEARVTRSVELANEASAYVYPVPNAPAEIFLAAVVAVRRGRDAKALESQARILANLKPVLEKLPHDFPNR